LPAQPVDATPPGINLSSKGGVHETRETMEAVCRPAGRYVEPLESWAAITCDWSSAGQGPCGHSASVGASWGNRSGRSSPFAAGTHPGRTRRHLPRNRQRLFDAGHRPTSESRSLHSKPRGSRHGGRAQYRANQADQRAWESALRPKPCLLVTHSKLQEIVASKLMQDWSPQQISGWLKQHYPDDESLRVSHETIYRSLFIQARGALKQELVRHLRSQRRIRARGTPAFTGTPKAGSSMPSPSAKDLRKSKIVPFPVIGRAICCPARATATSPHW